jgi:hypothetical protein
VAADPYTTGGAFARTELKVWEVVRAQPTLLAPPGPDPPHGVTGNGGDRHHSGRAGAHTPAIRAGLLSPGTGLLVGPRSASIVFAALCVPLIPARCSPSIGASAWVPEPPLLSVGPAAGLERERPCRRRPLRG